MCGPAAIPLAIASTAVAATGQIVSGIGQAQQYRYEASVAEENAKLSNQQASNSNDTTNLEAQRRYRELAQTKGAQAAGLAASGVDLNFGSAAAIQRDTAMIGGEDIGQLYKAGYERTRGYEFAAFGSRSQAAGSRAKASGAIINSVFQAAGTALGGASQVSRMKGK